MTEDEARGWIVARYGPEGSIAMQQIVNLVTTETRHQNLVAPSTLQAMWVRHVVDSAQLLDIVGSNEASGLWIDIGSGAGFPGLVVASLSQFEVRLVEPRARRAAFLEGAVATLGLSNRVQIVRDRIQAVTGVTAKIISARAVAPLCDLFSWGCQCATAETKWVIPKGRTAREDVATASKTWHSVFHVERSITDPDSLIVLASGVARR